jgi:hypothetical protein
MRLKRTGPPEKHLLRPAEGAYNDLGEWAIGPVNERDAMNRFAIVLAAIGLVFPWAAASAGNAASGGSSYVGPIGTNSRTRSTGVQQLTSNARVRVAPPPAQVKQATDVPRPTVSPYLNLFRPEASRVFNYYTLVRPQLAQDEINAQQASEIQALLQQDDEIASGQRAAPSTPPKRFMHYRGYYRAGR